jgi:hypothetical protein
MRRGWAIVAGVLVVLALIGVGVGAYNAGLHVAVRDAAESGRVVVGPGYGWHGYGWGGFGFFPFGLLFFPLLIIGIVLLVRFAMGGPRWGGWGPGPHAPRPDEARSRLEERFDEWHRRQHEQGSTSADPGGGTPAS